MRWPWPFLTALAAMLVCSASIVTSSPALNSGEYPTFFESLDQSTYNIFHEGRQWLCNASESSFVEERTLFPFGNCDGDNLTWKAAFDGKKVPIHILWRGIAKNSLYATLDALVATQDLSMFSIWLWFSQGKQRESSHWLQSYQSLRYRYKRLIDQGHMSINITEWSSVLDASTILSDPSRGWTYKDIPDISVASLSDVVRLTILYEYGGIYLDEDVLAVRDFSPYLRTNCEWIASQHNHHFNNHIMMLQPHSPTATFLLKAVTLFPWNRPEVWPAQPLTKQHGWVYNDALTQYCIKKPDECRIRRLPMFLVDHHMHNLCLHHHFPGCLHLTRASSTPLDRLTFAERRREVVGNLSLSLRLSTLHRHVPHKGECLYDMLALDKPSWTNPDTILFHLIRQRVHCHDDAKPGQVCAPPQPQSLQRSFINYLAQEERAR